MNRCGVPVDDGVERRLCRLRARHRFASVLVDWCGGGPFGGLFGAVLQQLQHPRDEQGHDDDENDVAAGERSPQQEPHDRERDHDRADEDPVPAQLPAEPAGLETAPASPSFGSWARYVIG